MAKHRPHGPKKGHSSGRPKSGQRSLSGARPGSGSHGPRKSHGPRPAAGPKRHDRPTAASAGPRPSESRTRVPFEPGKPERLQKLLAQAGLGSRRGCEELIRQGRVSVDGQVIRELGTRVDPSAKIAVDGEPIRLESLVYYAVNKPEGYVFDQRGSLGSPPRRSTSSPRSRSGSTPSAGSTRTAPG